MSKGLFAFIKITRGVKGSERGFGRISKKDLMSDGDDGTHHSGVTRKTVVLTNGQNCVHAISTLVLVTQEILPLDHRLIGN